MGKSSSSSKKKRSRNRFRARIMKKSKSKSKSKSRRNKSKKLRRRDDSVSYSDDSDSRRLVSVSSSSSEDDYASRRSRSRTRKDAKGSRKRVQRRSLSTESSLDSPRVRKKKKSRSSRRDDNYERRDKAQQKKKPRRGVSVSSASSGSRSCSCRSGSSRGTDESEFERRRGRYERKEKRRKRFEKVKTGSRKSRDRMRSSSSCSRYSEYQSEERVVEQDNSRRLRSVITVIKEEKEERELAGDEHKEEFIYDHDDYPSSKSNDSNSDRREFPQHSHVEHGKKDHDEQGEKTDISNFRVNSVLLSGKYGISTHDVGGKNYAIDERKDEASGAVGSLYGDDLESILRQGALENLKKFRGMQTSVNIPADQKDKNDANVNTLSKEEPESVRLKSTREDESTGVTASSSSQQLRLPATRKDSSGLPLDMKIPEGNDGNDSQTAECDVASVKDQLALACSPKEKVNVAINFVSIKRAALRQESPNVKLGSASKEHSQTMLIPRSKGNETAAEPAHSVEPLRDNNNGDKTKNVHCSTASDEPSSCPGSMLADISPDKLQDGTKEEGSQFEQKTMSVMRGGELVEVSYKVYIPKKAPALARRQLKR